MIDQSQIDKLALYGVKLPKALAVKLSPNSLEEVKAYAADCNHNFTASLRHLLRSEKPCRVCSGRELVLGLNDAATLHPELAPYWSPDNLIAFSSVGLRSSVEYLWRCELGHETLKTVQRKISKPLCPVCTNRVVIAGFNDMATTRPDLAKLWSLNNAKTTAEVTAGSGDRGLWLCAKGHEWDRIIVKMANDTDACPVCSGYKAIPGVMSAMTEFPELRPLWSPKNEQPFEILDTIGSRNWQQYWWRCDEGHDTFTTHDVRAKFGCGKCQASKGEKELAAYLAQTWDIELRDRKIIKPYEIDIVIPELKLGIEYNGDFWHGEHSEKTGGDPVAYHTKKLQLAKTSGYKLIFVWDSQWTNSKPQLKSLLDCALVTNAFDRSVFEVLRPPTRHELARLRGR